MGRLHRKKYLTLYDLKKEKKSNPLGRNQIIQMRLYALIWIHHQIYQNVKFF